MKPGLLNKAFGTAVSIKPGNHLPYTYYVRHNDDNWDEPCTLERHVVVNRYCTVYSATPLLPDGENWTNLSLDQKEALKHAMNKKGK